MPKKSSGSKSKRMTLRQKYKIKRKVKEHHKKKAKELKKKGGKEKAPKDPGLPSQWPFREELVKEFAFKRAQILAAEKLKKDQKKARRQANRDGTKDDQDMAGDENLFQLAKLQASVDDKQADFETRKRARIVTDDFQSDKDNSKKAFYKEFKRVVQLSDVVIQVLDARDPLACRCPDVERYIRTTNPNKRIVLLLNKMDLVPREVGEKWLKFFREELPTVAFKCSTQQQAEKLGRRKMPGSSSNRVDEGSGLQGSGCLGADTLIQLLKNYCRNTGIKTAITVGVVGLPNVGKSSLINSLKRARVAQVGNTPGVTKGVQEVHLDKNIKLLDSPGIVFASAESDAAAVLRNCVKIEKLADPVSPISEILKRVPAKQLMQLYKIPAFADGGADKFLQHVAHARGKLRKGGVPDMVGAAKVVLQDWNDGRIPYFTSPPSRGNEEFASAEVVGAWARDFDAEAVFANERSAVIAHLPSMEDAEGAAGSRGRRAAAGGGGSGFFQLESLGGAKVDIDAMDADDEEEDEEEDEDEEDEDEEDEDMAPPSKRTSTAGSGGAAGAAVLYSEAGQFNPHAARADRKKAKKDPSREQLVAAAKARKQKNQQEEDEEEDFEFEQGDDDGEGEDAEEEAKSD